MSGGMQSLLDDQRESQTIYLPVVDIEKQLLASIHSKGILHSDTIDLYHKVRAGYEEIILNNHQSVDLQEAEYLLWKLHYKHIDEFRKRLRQLSSNAENTKRDALNNDSQNIISKHLEGFKSFLCEAAEFYKDLILKLRKSCGVLEKSLLDNKNDETIKNKYEYACHRFLVCLGDLARYGELIKKPDACKWSTAATYYIEATRTWPDSGNPHNQLALLATYVGDSFLALYHCVRSLAVKEPFPDAWNNLMLLFEKNRSSQLHLLSGDAHVDFLNPSQRCSLEHTSQEEDPLDDGNSEGAVNVSSGEHELWLLFVWMISFFLVKSSLEDFPHALASFISRLEALSALNNAELNASLESYEQVDPSRRGPYRALQFVCILIFVTNSLTQSLEAKESDERDEFESSSQTHLAISATFICMGRVTERCLKGDEAENCPLVPAVLVFVEWLVGILDRAEPHAGDERVTSSMSYFFDTLVDFLNFFYPNESETGAGNTALWEDHELRGFDPLSHAHALLDFKTDRECVTKFKNGNLSRFSRIFDAAVKIVNRSSGSRNWICYDQVRRKFSTEEEVKVEAQPEQSYGRQGQNSQFTATDEEEVILFKPITRHNSVPVYSDATGKSNSLDYMSVPKTLDGEWLRRSMSLLIGQSSTQADTFKQREAPSAGPPSLSAWVVSSGESSSTARENEHKDFKKQELSPIDEMASTSFTNLSINETSIIGSSPPYVAPLPSAPLLPDDAAWFTGNEADGILGAGPTTGYTYRPPHFGMSSSEWLYHYRNSHNMEHANNQASPLHFNAPPLGNFYANNALRFDFYDQWGNYLAPNPTIYMANAQLHVGLAPFYGSDEQRRDMLLLNNQRSFPYVCGVGTELRTEQPPLLQYLKEREWQLHPDFRTRDHTFM